MARTPIDLETLLASFEPVRMEGIRSAWRFTESTPANRFDTAMALFKPSETVVATIARDSFDIGMACDVLRHVRRNVGLLSPKVPVKVIEGFRRPPFDCIGVLAPNCAKQFGEEHPQLNRRTYVAFPALRCELSGDESCDEIETLRHGSLSSLDWGRKPEPKVSMSFSNLTTGVRSRSRQPRLTTRADVLMELRSAVGADESWLVVENFRKEQVRFTARSGAFTMTCDQETVEGVSLARSVKWLAKFLIGATTENVPTEARRRKHLA